MMAVVTTKPTMTFPSCRQQQATLSFHIMDPEGHTHLARFKDSPLDRPAPQPKLLQNVTLDGDFQTDIDGSVTFVFDDCQPA